MKKIFLSAFVMIVILSTCAGCEKMMELTEEEEDLVVAYGVNFVLKYDYNYHDKLIDPEETTVMPETSTGITSEPSMGQTSTGQTSTGQNIETSTSGSGSSYVSLDHVMNVDGFRFEAAGYEVCESYSDKATGQTISAPYTLDKNLLVLKVNVKNISSGTAELDLINKGEYIAVVNDSKRLNLELSVHDFTFFGYKGSFNADEEKQLVLSFLIDKSVEVKTVSLSVKNGSRAGTVAFD